MLQRKQINPIHPNQDLLSPRIQDGRRCLTSYGDEEPIEMNGVPCDSPHELHARIASFDILGFKISPATMPELFRYLAMVIDSSGKTVVVSQNLHGIYTYFKNADFRALHRIATVRIDGMPIVWMARAFGLMHVCPRHRVAWIDMFWPLMRRANEAGWRIFYLGATRDVLDKGLHTIRTAIPTLAIAANDGFFNADTDSKESNDVIDQINEFSPHILIVGMGMPRQEAWILNHLNELNVNAIMTCGACMEFVAGTVPTPPRWLGILCMEWLYRMGTNPRRFIWRYFCEPWITLVLLVQHYFQTRRA